MSKTSQSGFSKFFSKLSELRCSSDLLIPNPVHHSYTQRVSQHFIFLPLWKKLIDFQQFQYSHWNSKNLLGLGRSILSSIFLPILLEYMACTQRQQLCSRSNTYPTFLGASIHKKKKTKKTPYQQIALEGGNTRSLS